MSKCLHRNSIAVDIDGAGEDFRFCNDCGENFWLSVPAPAPALSARDIERQILVLVEGSIEDTRVPDAIAAHADKRVGKPVTKTDAEQLEAQLDIPVRIRRQFGMTHVAWTDTHGKREERSILLGHSETNVRWPSGADLRAKEPAYFGARDERNASRRQLLQEHATLRGAIGGETPDHDDASAVYRAACAITKLHEARAALEDLIEDGQPLHVMRFAIEKLAGK
jgi:hypothetical protein